jgi:DNA (cytosine-5)-methyltransferase 1
MLSLPLHFESDAVINTNHTTIPILSFFTGAGLLDIGFMQAGFNIVWRNELDPWFIKGFEHGMLSLTGSESSSKIQNTKSIVDLSAKEILSESFHNTQRPKAFGIIGGPPCPDFSVGGKNKGGSGDQGKLSQVFVNLIMEIQPSFFLFENVPGLLRTNKHKLFFDKLYRQLARDFFLDYAVLSALEYGVPQDRGRVFLVGVKKDWANTYLSMKTTTGSKWFPWPSKRYENAKTCFKWPSVSPFGGNPEQPQDIPLELTVGPLICNLEELSSIPNGLEGFRPYSEKFYLIPEGDVSRKSFKRLHRWRYSPTAAYGHNEVHLHPTEARRLTVREAMRIQTIPDEYALPKDMPLTKKFQTIGNGVPVKLASEMAKSFIRLLGKRS